MNRQDVGFVCNRVEETPQKYYSIDVAPDDLVKSSWDMKQVASESKLTSEDMGII